MTYSIDQRPTRDDRRPITLLAIFISAGIHGLLLIASPWLSGSGGSRGVGTNGAPRNVRIVELSPEQLSRLPQASGLFEPNTAFLGQPSAPLLPRTDGASGLFGSPSGFPPMSDDGTVSGWTPPPPPPPPPDNWTSGGPFTGTSQNGLITSSEKLGTPEFGRDSGGPPTQAHSGSNTETPTDSNTETQTDSNTETQTDSNPTSTPSPTMARSSGGIESVKKDIERMRQKLAYNAEGTTTAEGYDNSGKRLKRVRGELNKPDLVPVQYPGTIAASYPRQAKFSRLKGNVVVEVTIDPEGKIVGSPEVSQSSGYPILNQAAVDAVSAHPFQATGKHQYYWIKLTFEPPADSTPLTPKVTPKSAPAPDAPEPSQGEAPPEPSQEEAPPEPSQEEAAPSSDEAT